MKTFLEEYGLVIVAVIVVALLVTLAIYFGTVAKTNTKNTFNDFANSTSTIASTGAANASTLMGTIDANATSTLMGTSNASATSTVH